MARVRPARQGLLAFLLLLPLSPGPAVAASAPLPGPLPARMVRVIDGDTLEVRYGKFAGRVVAKVATPDGQDLSDALVSAGLARRAERGARRSWCD